MSTILEGTLRTYTSERHDKSNWGDGPWQEEPDKATWVDDITDLDCMIHRGPSGALCGYVGVPRSHPLYGKDYNEPDVLVHGGLTYANACQEDVETESFGICHVPLEGREHDIWWFGFDCAHAFDLTPKYSSSDFMDWKKDDTYRDWAYVTEEVHELALQLRHIADTATAQSSGTTGQ